MAEGGYDPCECLYSHEGAMRRLISMLRNSQDSCSDTTCNLELPGPESADGNYTMMLFMMGWMVLALVLFLVRPSQLRARGDEKPRAVDHNAPEPPPVD
ncbi:Small integral membrane protein 14 [Holothuria leucospilota]|uniref:Small integral membrane protein 14 n=1 Tax=Holothuria leucospilota TaxID=206669 RepID=A0A9Q1CGA8_HOLLE|nr:Small integral membrane protein 14 [Holothuria leucospilota]